MSTATKSGPLSGRNAVPAGGHGIDVNAIYPGFVQNDMLDVSHTHADIQGVPFDKIVEAGLARVPLKRFLPPPETEIVELAVCLASAESDGMTDQALLAGGMLRV